MSSMRVAIVGGGAAGYFAAIACAERNPDASVTIFEASARPLAKVRISGGGRCNVTQACFDPREFVNHYPRGSREMLGPLHRFGPRETIAWFAARGVTLKAEPDRRMFPDTDNSATIVRCLENAAQTAGVQVRLRCPVRAVRVAHETAAGFQLTLQGGEQVGADRVLLATGGGEASAGFAFARALGHTIEPPVPSLFTFHVDDPRLQGLAGISVPDAHLIVPASRWEARGPLLITHTGLSGPAVLRLSAWAARDLHARSYRFPIEVRWIADETRDTITTRFEHMRCAHGGRHVSGSNPWGLPARLWERLGAATHLAETAVWAALSRESAAALREQLLAAHFTVHGKSANKEEFVTCGGVRLREIDFRTMESRVCPGLYVAGEVLDIDGLTGGFNFQAAWTTGWIAGQTMGSVGNGVGT